MAVYLHPPYEDELLYGLVHRYLKSMQVRSISHLNGFRPYTTNPDLEWWASQTEVCLGMSARQIAAELTISPFIAAMRSLLKNGEEIDHPGWKVTLRRHMTLPTDLRFCRECFALDFKDGRVPYWRRSHQLPGVLFCHVHGLVLSQTLRGLPDKDKYDTEIALSTGITMSLEVTEEQRRNCVSVAKVANWILTQRSGPIPNLLPRPNGLFEFEFVAVDESRIHSTVDLALIRASFLEFYGESFVNICKAMFGLGRGLNTNPPGIGRLLIHCMHASCWDFMWPKCVNAGAAHGRDFRVSAVKRTGTGWTAVCECGCAFDYTRTPSKRGAEFRVTNVRLP